MTNGDIWTLLERVGLARSDGARQVPGALDTLRDPAVTDQLAGALAERLATERPDVVVVWDGLHTAVLGYAVGFRLGVPVVILSDDEGLVTASTLSRVGSRAVFVAPTTPDAAIRRMVSGYLDSQGVSLAATATLLARAGARDTVTLAELPPEDERSAPQLRRMSRGYDDGDR